MSTATDAEALTRILVRPHRPVRIGEWVKEPPCIDLSGFEERHGRPCPRVDLDPENRDLAALFALDTREDLRAHGPAFFADTHAHLPPERRARVLRRYLRAMQTEAVVKAIYPTAEGD